jgi:hypothetical protein
VRKSWFLLVALSSAGVAGAQVTQHTGTPPNATHFLDFDSPFVASGPIAGTSNVFTAAGIASVAQFGATWTISGDTITAGSNGSGQSLVVQSNVGGTLSVAGIGQPLSNSGTGGGFDIVLASDATEFGVLFIDQINFNYTVELLDNGISLAINQFNYGGSFPAPPHYWTGPAPFDQIKITFLSSIGVGIDNFAFDGGGAPTSYCTAGTSTNGCTPAMAASAQPSASQANPCALSASGVEGQKTGLFFYGIDNTGFTPSSWGLGTSFLCVKAPTQRTTTQATGGTAGSCDGSLSLDWNAWQLANPTALGNPWLAGEKVYVQGWYRDPPAPKTTNLTDALEMTYVP